MPALAFMVGAVGAFLRGVVTLLSATFTGTDGSAVTGWTTRTGTATIQSNTAQLTTPGGGTYASCHIDATSMTATTDMNLTGTVTMTATGVEQYVLIGIGCSGTGAFEIDNGYAMLLQMNGTLVAMRNYTGGGAYTAIGSGATTISGGFTGGTATKFRLQYITAGGILRGRTWLASNAEPSTWDVSYTGIAAKTGVVGLTITDGGDATARVGRFDDILVTAS